MRKGFTLVELLAVIVILGIVAVITIPKIQDVLYHSQDEAYELAVTHIINKAKDYVDANSLSNEVTDDNPVDVYLSELITTGYIEEKDLADPRAPGDYINKDTSYVRFTLENGELKIKDYFTITTE